jgi:hypothetical protein
MINSVEVGGRGIYKDFDAMLYDIRLEVVYPSSS